MWLFESMCFEQADTLQSKNIVVATLKISEVAWYNGTFF